MSGINGIGGGNQYNYNLYNTQKDHDKHSRNVSSAKKLNQASDGAAEMAIAKKLANAAKGMSVGRENLQSGRSALYIADGGMDGVNDYLQRMRELSIRSQNPFMSDSDKQAMQDEVSQLTQGIDEAAAQTKYNEQPLLDEDGSVSIVANGDGSSVEVTQGAMTAQGLGVQNYSLLENFDLDKIDAAMEKVSSTRAMTGAQTNSIDHSMNYNAIAEENLTSSQSKLEDADIAEEMMALGTNKTLTAAQIMMQKRQEEDEQQKTQQLFAQ